MSNIITIGFATEGNTDVRFLQNIIQRTFEEIAFDCTGEIEVFDPVHLGLTRGNFMEAVEKFAKEAFKQGIMVLCVHADADASTDENTFGNKINPAFSQVVNSAGSQCKNLVAIVPIQMAEAWMVADVEILKNEIGTNLSPQELGLDRNPETITDPKEAISQAIRIAFSDLPKRRRTQLHLADLYLPVGQKANLENLERLTSFRKFKSAVREAYQKLNYLH